METPENLEEKGGHQQEINTADDIMTKLHTLQVTQFEGFIPTLIAYLVTQTCCFKSGRLAQFVHCWQRITSDTEILQMVSRQHIEFDTKPCQTRPPAVKCFSAEENAIISKEVANLLKKAVVVETSHEPGEFISSVFVRPKKDGSHRMILNLKNLNKHVQYNHFKMDTLQSVISLITPNCYMASVDLKDAYYSVPIAVSDQKYLKFKWGGKLYQFTCFPNGLAFCPRKFTKLMKPAYSVLRQLGHINSPYIDDSYLQGGSYEECLANVLDTVKMFLSLGFILHPQKSVFIPTQKLVFLGFVLDSVHMKIYLTNEKVDKLKSICTKLNKAKETTIREVSRALGYMVSSFPGVRYGPLYFCQLEREKTLALRYSKGDYDACMVVSDKAGSELLWWNTHLEASYNIISHGEPTVVMSTNASSTGWGCALHDTSTGGHWTAEEARNHINYLELLAIYLALKSFSSIINGQHVKVMVDNMTALSDVNHMGTSSSEKRNDLAKEIWLWCAQRNIWLTAVHIPGVENVEADKQSRRSHSQLEWTLDRTIFRDCINAAKVEPNIDLFASKINHQLQPYVSWHPDPGAVAIDAFHLSWKQYVPYMFPPFSLISRVLQKIQQEKVQGIIMVPKWPTQTWWPVLVRMLVDNPVLLPKRKKLLFLPSSPEKIHPLYPKLELLMCHLSGDHLKAKEFRQKLPESLCSLGDRAPQPSTKLTTRSGNHSAVDGKLIPFRPLYRMA